MKKLIVCCLVQLFFINSLFALKITVIGTGYVGLVTGACLALDHDVICCDIDCKKIDLLNKGIIPIYEPQLQELVTKLCTSCRKKTGSIKFTCDVAQSIQEADVLMVAVGTPTDDAGRADLSILRKAFETIAANLNGYKVIIIKSTVPIGTGDTMQKLIKAKSLVDFDLVSNPEFLREGSAVNDFLYPDRIVIGTSSKKAENVMREVYNTWIEEHVPFIVTDVVTSESIKYACNAFLASKISFINEFALLCDVCDADVNTVAYAMGLDKRIGPLFLKPGPGYGGSCFPKDTQALKTLAQDYACELRMVQATIDANNKQRKAVCHKIEKIMHRDLTGKTIAVLGLSFKPETDDVRYSCAIDTIEYLLEKKALVKAYDPIAMDNFQKIFPNITYCQSWMEAVSDADCLVLLTDWEEFKKIPLRMLGTIMKQTCIVDARNLWSPVKIAELGYTLENMGRKY